MAKLAIKGHATRGKEVKEILEMLGGNNKYEIISFDGEYFYFIKSNGIIDLLPLGYNKGFMVFTLEEFLEKFPYKVGGKVLLSIGGTSTIKSMYWNNEANSVRYKMNEVGDYDFDVSTLQPYTEQEEETMEETKKDLDWHPTDYLEFVDNDDTWADEVELNLGDSYEIIMKEGKYYAVKKQPQYPKTYEECCKLLNKTPFITFNGISLNEIERYKPFIMLCRCRDAYWKIAGDWKPDWKDYSSQKFSISVDKGKIITSQRVTGSRILVFPTEEMRDAFYENFKDLIEECKELL